MNEHEIERIAAAMHAARPDWPAQQLRTLLREKLADRPRRDVFVALAWVACESGTASPYRVLETGPWWKAAGAGDSGTGHRHSAKVYGTHEGDPRHICGICGLWRSECERRSATNGHGFVARIDCLPPTERGPLGERRTCLAGPPETPCRLLTGHEGQHQIRVEESADA